MTNNHKILGGFCTWCASKVTLSSCCSLKKLKLEIGDDCYGCGVLLSDEESQSMNPHLKGRP